MEIVFVAFKLKKGRDQDLIAWIGSLDEGDRSYHIRELLRRGLNMQAPSQLTPIRIQPKQTTNAETVKIDLDKNLQEWMTV